MDQDRAQKLFFSGGLFLLDSCPPSLDFGIDLTTWRTGEKFRGLKMIPPGLHFVHVAPIDQKSGHVGHRAGFFHFFEPAEVRVHKWNGELEEMEEMGQSEENMGRYKADIREFDQFLGPFPYDDSVRTWQSLSRFITKPVLETSQPPCGKISSFTSLGDFSELDKGIPNIEALKTPQKPGDKTQGAEYHFRFPKVDLKRSFPEGASVSVMTKYSMDKSWLLEKLADAYPTETDLVGELQFAFICFLVGQSFAAFERWKLLVTLFCGCDEAVTKRKDLFLAFFEALQFQILQIQDDLFMDFESSSNFLLSSLSTLLLTVKESDLSPNDVIRKRAAVLKNTVEQKFGWSLTLMVDEEDGEDAPVVVEM